MNDRKRKSRAFSLLELVVVMGIIALATAALAITVLKVRENFSDTTCQNNLRQLLGALEMYNVEYNGSMPYGIMFVNSVPPTWEPPPGGNDEFTSWASELNKYFTSSARGGGGYAAAFQCPQAQQQAGSHMIRSHDAIRRYFMIQWPPGVPRNPNLL